VARKNSFYAPVAESAEKTSQQNRRTTQQESTETSTSSTIQKRFLFQFVE